MLTPSYGTHNPNSNSGPQEATLPHKFSLIRNQVMPDGSSPSVEVPILARLGLCNLGHCEFYCGNNISTKCNSLQKQTHQIKSTIHGQSITQGSFT